jgi:hypothetical protein
MTSGLVGEMGFKVLPDVAPWVTLVATALSIVVSGCGFNVIKSTYYHDRSLAY